MRMTRSAVTVLAVLALALAFPLLAQKAEPVPSEHSCGSLNLTPEQAVKIEKLKIEHQKAVPLLQADQKTKCLELRQLMIEKADQKKLEAKIDELAKVGADIRKKCLAHKIEISRLLTDEQKKVFDQKCGGMGCEAGMGHGSGCGAGCTAHKMGNKGHAGHGAKGCGPKAGCDK